MKQRPLNIQRRIEELISYRDKMIAENNWREMNGEPLAYKEEDFLTLENKLMNLRQVLKEQSGNSLV